MATNRFDRPPRQIRFRDNVSQFVPEEFVDPYVDRPFVGLPLEALTKLAQQEEKKFVDAEKQVALFRSNLKPFGATSAETFDSRFKLDHRDRVSEIHKGIEDKLMEISSGLAQGDYSRLPEVYQEAINYTKNPELQYFRDTEAALKEYEEAVKEAKLTGDDERKNALEYDIDKLRYDSRAKVYGDESVDEAVDTHERLNKIFSQVKSDRTSGFKQTRLDNRSMGILKTNHEFLSIDQAKAIAAHGIIKDSGLFHKIKGIGQRKATKIRHQLEAFNQRKADLEKIAQSAQTIRERDLAENELGQLAQKRQSYIDGFNYEGTNEEGKKVRVTPIIFDEKGRYDDIATANRFVNQDFDELVAGAAVSYGFDKYDRSISDFDWFYGTKKTKETGLQFIETEGLPFVTDHQFLDDSGNLNYGKMAISLYDTSQELKIIEKQMQGPLAPGILGGLQARKADLEAHMEWTKGIFEKIMDSGSSYISRGHGASKTLMDHWINNVSSQTAWRGLLGPNVGVDKTAGAVVNTKKFAEEILKPGSNKSSTIPIQYLERFAKLESTKDGSDLTQKGYDDYVGIMKDMINDGEFNYMEGLMNPGLDYTHGIDKVLSNVFQGVVESSKTYIQNKTPKEFRTTSFNLQGASDKVPNEAANLIKGTIQAAGPHLHGMKELRTAETAGDEDFKSFRSLLNDSWEVDMDYVGKQLIVGPNDQRLIIPIKIDNPNFDPDDPDKGNKSTIRYMQFSNDQDRTNLTKKLSYIFKKVAADPTYTMSNDDRINLNSRGNQLSEKFTKWDKYIDDVVLFPGKEANAWHPIPGSGTSNMAQIIRIDQPFGSDKLEAYKVKWGDGSTVAVALPNGTTTNEESVVNRAQLKMILASMEDQAVRSIGPTPTAPNTTK